LGGGRKRKTADLDKKKHLKKEEEAKVGSVTRKGKRLSTGRKKTLLGPQANRLCVSQEKKGKKGEGAAGKGGTTLQWNWGGKKKDSFSRETRRRRGDCRCPEKKRKKEKKSARRAKGGKGKARGGKKHGLFSIWGKE